MERCVRPVRKKEREDEEVNEKGSDMMYEGEKRIMDKLVCPLFGGSTVQVQVHVCGHTKLLDGFVCTPRQLQSNVHSPLVVLSGENSDHRMS